MMLNSSKKSRDTILKTGMSFLCLFWDNFILLSNASKKFNSSHILDCIQVVLTVIIIRFLIDVCLEISLIVGLFVLSCKIKFCPLLDLQDNFSSMWAEIRVSLVINRCINWYNLFCKLLKALFERRWRLYYKLLRLFQGL